MHTEKNAFGRTFMHRYLKSQQKSSSRWYNALVYYHLCFHTINKDHNYHLLDTPSIHCILHFAKTNVAKKRFSMVTEKWLNVNLSWSHFWLTCNFHTKTYAERSHCSILLKQCKKSLSFNQVYKLRPKNRIRIPFKIILLV